jgi:hypothetical protein
MEGHMTDPFECYEADGLPEVRVPIGPKTPSSTVPDMTGGTAQVWAKRFNTEAVAGVAAITGPDELTYSFPPWALARGMWKIQVRAAPPNTALQTINDDELTVHPSIVPQ